MRDSSAFETIFNFILDPNHHCEARSLLRYIQNARGSVFFNRSATHWYRTVGAALESEQFKKLRGTLDKPEQFWVGDRVKDIKAIFKKDYDSEYIELEELHAVQTAALGSTIAGVKLNSLKHARAVDNLDQSATPPSRKKPHLEFTTLSTPNLSTNSGDEDSSESEFEPEEHFEARLKIALTSEVENFYGKFNHIY
ncbi:hypothetical protein HDU87_001124 [Geranomyces variabilis]|uniref:Uncharacterized protein n=1 Tax=Geranomyces variabilis TaxID=109894 RepID=A0AAD5TMZ8_9FUNG|nr:hypothetical protein HDU87_001124 [Geranomyces variabilis]